MRLQVLWSIESRARRNDIVEYLKAEWSVGSAIKFKERLRLFENIVAEYPELYAQSKEKQKLRKAVIPNTSL
jgi:plasmid stabilization system protein ParE